MALRQQAFVFLLVSLMLSACARTQVTGVWQKEGFAGPPMRSLIIFGQPTQRQERSLWESIISDRFRRSGMNAVAALNSFPPNTPGSLLEVLDHAKAKGVEGVLVIRDRGSRGVATRHAPEVDVYVTPYWYPYGHRYPYFYPWYPPFFPYTYYEYSPGYTTYHNVVTVESFLYLAQTGEQVWNMTTRTVDPLSTNALIGDVSRNVFRGLRRANLIQLNK